MAISDTRTARRYRGAAAVVIALWSVLQMPLWFVPPFSDALGHHFPQAWLLLQSGWSFHAVAASNAVEHPPLISAITAAAWILTGVNTIVPHVIATVIGAVALAGVFRLGSTLGGDRRALFALICVAANAVFFAQSSNPYIEIAVVAGLVWGIDSFLRGSARGVFLSLMLMTLAKETSLPLAGGMFLFALWSERRNLSRRTWIMLGAIIASILPAVGWLVYAAGVKGGFMAASVHAAATNGSIAGGAYSLVRKLALGWVQLALLGLWIPLLVGIFLIVGGRYRGPRFRLPGIRGQSLLLFLAVVSVTEHGVISIGLNRYYLPALTLLWIVAWNLLPDTKRVATAVVCATVFWGTFGYLSRVRYAILDDSIAGPRMALAHRSIDRRLASEHPREPVLTSYPMNLELQDPFLGYVAQPVPTRELADSSVSAGSGGIAVTSDDQMEATEFRRFLSDKRARVIAVEPYPGGAARLLRFD